ncbi:MAG: T9SS type A sorting domain-containing protein [Bacteroidales bacterium]|nr:T9SS type A sorting domain-containing protein [Bacteroidales bacterium]
MKRIKLVFLFHFILFSAFHAQDLEEKTSMPRSDIKVAESGSAGRSGILKHYPTYPEYETAMHNYALNYPDICLLDTFATLPSGRRLLMLVIDDNPDSLEKEPVFFYTSTMHGDETEGYILMLNLIDTLLRGYDSVPRITSLVNTIKICINPLANPDGTYAGGNSSVNGATRFNSNNVDLNRNFPDPEDGMHPDGNAWQEETKAFMTLADSLGFHISANLHSGTEVVNYPWDTWMNVSANENWWLLVGNEYADTAQYYGPSGYFSSVQFPDGVTKGYDWYSINGGRQDYMNYFHYCREMTLELSMQKLLPESYLPVLWEANYRSLLNYIEQATFGVSGTISDSLSGQPLKAKVFINNFDVDSSHVYSRSVDGYYHRYLASGNYTLTYSAPGYVSKNKSVNFMDYHNQTMNVQLVPDNVSAAYAKYDRFKIYPNPTSYSINIKSDFKSSQMIRVNLKDVTGKMIKMWKFDSAKKNVSFVVDDIPSGIYFIHISSDQRDYTDKIIIQ